MAEFTGKNICDTYQSILNLGACATTNETLDPTNYTTVTDGIGQQSSLYLRTTGNGGFICGQLQIRGSGGINMCAHSIINANTVCATNFRTTAGYIADGGITSKQSILACGNLTSNSNICGNGVLTVTGVIRGCSDIIAFYSSDERLKENVNKIVNSKEVVNNLTGYSFDWKEEADREGKDFGVMAQDVEKVLPELVHERPDGFKSVDYVKIIPYLIEEVKRLDAEVEELKSIQTF